MKIQVSISPEKIRSAYGLGPSSRARRFLAAAVARRCDKYVPKDTGALKNTAQISGDGRSITYIMPYAKKQYTGNYRHSDPNRGPYWDKRMLAGERGPLLSEFKSSLKGAAK